MSANAYELPWSGEPFRGADFLSFDTETAVQRPDGSEYQLDREIPPMVLATVSDGTRHVVLTPDQIPQFAFLHKDVLLVGHNIAFDYWVTLQVLMRYTGSAAHHWRRQPDRNLMDDTMLLDFLVRLADPNAAATDGMRNLDQVAKLVGMAADKQSDYRLRFHELIGQDWSKADPGFFEYAVQDTIVTWHVYKHLLERAGQMSYEGQVPRDQYDKHGPLTSRLQTRASIVLAQIGRNGMAIDQSKVVAVRDRLRSQVAEYVKDLATYQPSLFGYFVRNPRTGVMKVNKKTLVPNLNYTNLRKHLIDGATRIGLEIDKLPKTPQGSLATRLDFWRRYEEDIPLVRTWVQMADTAKVLQFVAQVDGQGSVHPGYYTIVRTGRTSCRQPNIQQMPKERWFRELFVPRPGQRYVIVDYSAIELRTLAAVLLNLYGKSRLAEVLREGVDPHSYTAAIVLGVPYEDVLEGVKLEKAYSEPGHYSRARQSAKAINFGVPGGLGAKRLCDYARSNYGVEMTEQEARDLRNTLVYEVYPELEKYLSYDVYEVLAQNMQTDASQIRDACEYNGITSWHVERVLRRDGETNSREKLPQALCRYVWGTVDCLNQNPYLSAAIASRKADTRGLCGETVCTLTGRIRAGVDYGEARNTRFQGLAADGAKVALWNLHTASYRIVGFIHDEIVCEVPEERAEEDRQEIERIMKDSMASVLLCDIPVEVEGCVASAWVK